MSLARLTLFAAPVLFSFSANAEALKNITATVVSKAINYTLDVASSVKPSNSSSITDADERIRNIMCFMPLAVILLYCCCKYGRCSQRQDDFYSRMP